VTPTVAPTTAPTTTEMVATATGMPSPVPATEIPVEPTATLPPTGPWKIFFWGRPCVSGGECDPDAPDDTSSQLYSLLSDGSELKSIGDRPLDDPILPRELVPLLQESPFDPLDDGCFAFYEEDSAGKQVKVRHYCARDAEAKDIATVEIPPTPDGQTDFFRFYRLSPRADKLLIHIKRLTGEQKFNIEVFVKNLKNDEAPQMVFHSPHRACQRYWIQNPVSKRKSDVHKPRWRADGETIDLLWTSFCDGQAENIFFQIDWRGQELKTRLSLSGTNFVIDYGDWSPDRRQFAFSYMPVVGDEYGLLSETLSGVYLLDLETGQHHPLLTGFYVFKIWARDE